MDKPCDFCIHYDLDEYPPDGCEIDLAAGGFLGQDKLDRGDTCKFFEEVDQMTETQRLLQEASSHLRQAKVALYKAEEQAANERKNELNDLWWMIDAIHGKLGKLI